MQRPRLRHPLIRPLTLRAIRYRTFSHGWAFRPYYAIRKSDDFGCLSARRLRCKSFAAWYQRHWAEPECWKFGSGVIFTKPWVCPTGGPSGHPPRFAGRSLHRKTKFAKLLACWCRRHVALRASSASSYKQLRAMIMINRARFITVARGSGRTRTSTFSVCHAVMRRAPPAPTSKMRPL
jgi:hypothetical protein